MNSEQGHSKEILQITFPGSQNKPRNESQENVTFHSEFCEYQFIMQKYITADE